MPHQQEEEWLDTVTSLCLSLVYELARKQDSSDAVNAEDDVALWTHCSEYLVAGQSTLDSFLQKAVNFLLSECY